MSHTPDRPRGEHLDDVAPGAPTEAATSGKHTAGAFDIRNIIGALLGVYGLLLLLASVLFPGSDKTGGLNANLWAGIAMVLAAAAFMGWARAKPIVVPEHVAHDGGNHH